MRAQSGRNRPTARFLEKAFASLAQRVRFVVRRRVRLQQQLTQDECGTACLAMLMSYYGRKTGVMELREVCNPGRDGLSVATLASTAESFGFSAKGYTLEPASFSRVALPAILH